MAEVQRGPVYLYLDQYKGDIIEVAISEEEAEKLYFELGQVLNKTNYFIDKPPGAR